MSYKILVALDFSKLGKEVAAYGYELGKRFEAEITFMHIVPEPAILFNSYALNMPIVLDSNMAEMKRTAERKLRVYIEETCRKHNADGGNCTAIVEIGDPAQNIIEYAKENLFDMIVLGYRGHSTIDALLVGSTANKVTRYAPCSVLIYRPEKAKA